MIVTSSLDVGQTPFEMVHLKVVEKPIVSPVTVDVAEDGDDIAPEPDTTVQTPVPVVGALPASI